MDTDSVIKQLTDNQRRSKKNGASVKPDPKDMPKEDIRDAVAADKVSISNKLPTSGVNQNIETENTFRDWNAAQEAANIVKNSILTNPGTAMSAQAYQLPDNIMNLLG